jgi:hypothetical protein
MQRQRYRGVESNLFHQFLPPSDFFLLICWCQNYSNMWIVQQMSFQPLTSLVSLFKTSMIILFMSRNGHDKNMTKMYGNGLMFWVKEWTFKPRNGLFCLGMVWLNISDVKREQWLCRSSSVHTRIKSWFSCLTTFTVMYFNWFVNMTAYHSLLWYTVSVLSFRCVECPGT